MTESMQGFGSYGDGNHPYDHPNIYPEGYDQTLAMPGRGINPNEYNNPIEYQNRLHMERVMQNDEYMRRQQEEYSRQAAQTPGQAPTTSSSSEHVLKGKEYKLSPDGIIFLPKVAASEKSTKGRDWDAIHRF